MKTDEEKQATKDARNQRRREAKAAAKVEAEELEGMVDVATLSPGDTFTLDEVNYIVLSIDKPSNHIHTNLLEEEESSGRHGSVDFGTLVDIIAKAEAEAEPEAEEEEAVVVPPVPENPATTGGRWFK